MTNQDLKEMIKREVWAAAAAKLKQERQAQANAPRPDEPPKLEDREFDNLLFNGGYEDMGFHKIYGLSENTQPQINSSEIQDFEKKFAEILTKYPNATVSFDEQGRQKKSMVFKPGPKGTAVTATGYIQLGNEGNIRWMFSIPNGLRIETDGIEITQENRDIFTDIYNYYNDWQRDWRKKLTGNESAPENFGDEMLPGAEQPGMVPGLSSAPGVEAGAGAPGSTSPEGGAVGGFQGF